MNNAIVFGDQFTASEGGAFAAAAAVRMYASASTCSPAPLPRPRRVWLGEVITAGDIDKHARPVWESHRG